MMYAVYTDDAMINGIYENDLMDWYENREEAETAAAEMAEATGKTAYLSEVQDGDFGDREEYDA